MKVRLFGWENGFGKSSGLLMMWDEGAWRFVSDDKWNDNGSADHGGELACEALNMKYESWNVTDIPIESGLWTGVHCQYSDSTLNDCSRNDEYVEKSQFGNETAVHLTCKGTTQIKIKTSRPKCNRLVSLLGTCSIVVMNLHVSRKILLVG